MASVHFRIRTVVGQELLVDARTVLARIIKIAYDEGMVSVNHAARIGSVYKADRSENIWEDHHIESFLAKASPEIAFALRLALDSGQRQRDLINLTWNAYKNGALHLRQSKTKRRVAVPVTRLLAEELEKARRGDSLVILLNSRGLPWTQSGFQSSWHKTARAAGITDRTFHDLRGTAVTRMGENGCTGPEIAAVTGHALKSVEKILDTYLARTERMARNAIAKVEAGR
ncbi:MAG: tyrosine-type recombinase/integrase [Hyphomicrobiaceae bacterium]